MPAPLLIELLTEELPPKSLRRLQDAFVAEIGAELGRLRLAANAKAKAFATPRRLALLIENVSDKSADTEQSVDGPQSSNAKAVEGFARKHKLEPKDLQRKQTPKGEIAIANVMRWGSGEAQFVRPVHGLVMLHGSRVVPGRVLDVASGNRTRGHRFM